MWGCLARLSNFTEYEGSFWLLNEDARSRPPLDDPLPAKLVEFATSNRPRLSTSAVQALLVHNYGLDNHQGQSRYISEESSLRTSKSHHEMDGDSQAKRKDHTEEDQKESVNRTTRKGGGTRRCI